jgi:N-acetylglucosaminyldiphosphoundecaprenol N-acetyl-beta-D-mannosaminyltransferase
LKNSQSRTKILGFNLDLIDMRQATEKIKQSIMNRQQLQVVTLNAEMVYQAWHNPELKSIINQAPLIVPDGIGVVWAARQFGARITERVTGIDLLLSLCQEAASHQWKIFLLGAQPGVAERAGKKLQEQFPGLIIGGTIDGYFSAREEPEIIEKIRQSQPDIIFVALGFPKQELWIAKNQDKLGATVSIGIGGSLDVISGNKKRAPQFFIKHNLEWLYRLIDDPGRFKRQLVLPAFVLLVLKHKYLNK